MSIKTGVLQQESELPKLSGLQFDGQGNLVNLYRGQVSFPIELLNLPGRNGLSYGLSLLYSSDQAMEQVDKWNLNASADIVGLGWQLPYERIVVEAKSNGTTDDNQYFWIMSGQPTPLLAKTFRWQRGLLGSNYLATLTENFEADVVSAALQIGLHQQQIVVSNNTTIQRVHQTRWILKDAVKKRDFILEKREDNTISVLTGGLSFELYNYQYWQIIYYIDYERWEIIKNDGGIYSFGDPDAERIDPLIPANAVQYGIKWGNWIGPSMEAAGQERYVKGWNLTKIENTLGNYYLINYQVEEQAVGAGTEKYTKNCQVSKVKNDLGWSVVYNYADKTYDNSTLESPKEYLDPHKSPMSSASDLKNPDAYQSTYLTQYLSQLIVYNSDNEVQTYINFEYDTLWNSNPPPAFEASDQVKLAYGATFERLLKSITQYPGETYSPPGTPTPAYPTSVLSKYTSPPILFEYYKDEQPKGLLKEIINSSGGKTIFNYEAKTFLEDSRSRIIYNPFAPSSSLKNGLVRTWYGQDYIVCCWYDDNSGNVKYNVFTWLGRWEQAFSSWQTLSSGATAFAVDIDRLRVIPSQNTFLIVAPAADGSTSFVYFFNRFKLRNADWVKSNSDGRYNTNQLKVTPGADFYLIQDDDNQRLDRYTWNMLNQNWDPLSNTTISADLLWYVTASESYYVVFSYDPLNQSGLFKFVRKDILGGWIENPPYPIPSISIPGFNNFRYFQMSPSQSFVAMSYVTEFTINGSGGFNAFDYKIMILTWDINYTLSIVEMDDINNIESGRFNIVPSSLLYTSPGIGPVVINNSIIGTGPNIIRYNGTGNATGWKCESLGIDYEGFTNLAQQYYWYAYDEQGLIKTENTDSGILSRLGWMNPSLNTPVWIIQTLLDVPEHIIDRYWKAYPTDAGQYITVGDKVYSKPLSSNWSNLPELIPSINAVLNMIAPGETVDTTTMINSGDYLVFLILDVNQSPKDTGIIYFRNGTFVRDDSGNLIIDRFDGQQIFQLYTVDHAPKGNVDGRISSSINSLVTYPLNTTLDDTSSITLHRYTAEDFVGSISGYVVKEIESDSGYESLYKSYQYDEIQSAADGFRGSILKFGQVTEYNGNAGIASSLNGYTISHFYNGLPDSEDQEEYYSILDGQLKLKEMRDSQGVVVSSARMIIEVVQTISTNSDGSGVAKIFGFISQLKETISVQEGIERRSTSIYSPASGNVIETQSSYYDSQGREIINRSTTRYAYEVYPGIWDQNMLSLQIDNRSFVQDKNSSIAATLISSQVQTYKLWDADEDTVQQWGTWKKYIANKTDPSTFTWWNTGEPISADGWTKTEEILLRDVQGNVICASDTENIKRTAIYDTNNIFALATFTNATFEDGISYTSFEDYQANPWILNDEQAGGIIDNYSFTGNKCFKLESFDNTTNWISQVVNINNANQYYCFNLWLKTPKDAGENDRIELEVTAIGSTIPLIIEPPLTYGEWQSYQWVVNLNDLGVTGPVDATLYVKFTSSTVGYVLIDDIIFSPLLSPFAAQAYDMKKLRSVASLSANGISSKPLYDMWGQYSDIGPYNQTSTLSSTYLVRQNPSYNPEDPHDPFPTTNPNFSMNMIGREKGFYDLLKSSEESLENYNVVAGDINNWDVNNRTLTIDAGNGFQVLEINNYSQKDLSVYVNVVPTFSSSSSNPGQIHYLGIKETSGTPSRFIVQWNGIDTNIWQILKWDGSNYHPVPEYTNNTIPWQPRWLLTIFEDRLFFTANGILIFNYQDPDLATSEHTVQLGTYYYDPVVQGQVGFRNITIVDDIQMAISYMDGMGKTLQESVAESSDSVIMTPAVYDALGRSTINILPSRIQNEVAGVTNAFAYYDGFITNGYSTSPNSIWDGYPIIGPISNYHEDAEGYPFSRTVYEKSPLARPLQSGQPGLPYAITAAGNTHITTYTYGINTTDPGFLYSLPLNQYYVTTVTDPDGNQSTQYTTTAGQTVGTLVTGPGGINLVKSSQVYDMKGQIVQSVPPNYYASIADSSIISTHTYDFWGRSIETYSPDVGVPFTSTNSNTRVIYDIMGRPRFNQNARGKAANVEYYSYMKYDILGRPTEIGICNQAWDQSILEAAANNPTYPTSSIKKRNETIYDGDNSTANMIGREWYTIAYNDDGLGTDTADIKKSYTYRPTGETLSTTQTPTYNGVSGVATIMYYEYTINGRQVSISDSVTSVVSQFNVNKLEQLIETAVTSATISGPNNVRTTYEYDQEGSIETIKLYKPDGTLLTGRDYTYLPKGSLLTANDNYVDQTLQYTTGKCDNVSEGYYNGALAHNQIIYTGATPTTPSDYCYTVDHLNRVVSANNTGGAQYEWAFDPNSNFTSYTINTGTPEVRTYVTATNKNQLTNISSTNPPFAREVFYNEVGDTKSIKSGITELLEFEYNNWNNKARNIYRDIDNVKSVFDYGPDNEKIRKRIYNSSTNTLIHTVYSAGDLEIEDDGVTTQTKRYVEMGGIVLVYHLEAAKFYWVLPDHLGSTRMVIDEVGTVEYLYNYDVYGTPTIQKINTNSDLIFNNLFTGQYWESELQLYNYNARFYDPTIMRFLQTDPANQFFNPYSYVGGMPNMANDPSGMIVQTLLVGAIGLGIMAIGAILAGISQIKGIKGTDNEKILLGVGLGTILVGTIVATAGFSAYFAGSATVGASAFATPTVGAGVSMGTQVLGNRIEGKRIDPNELLISGIFGAAAAGFGRIGQTVGSKWAGNNIGRIFASEAIGQGLIQGSTNMLEQLSLNAYRGKPLDNQLGSAFGIGFGGGFLGGSINSIFIGRFINRTRNAIFPAGTPLARIRLNQLSAGRNERMALVNFRLAQLNNNINPAANDAILAGSESLAAFRRNYNNLLRQPPLNGIANPPPSLNEALGRVKDFMSFKVLFVPGNDTARFFNGIHPSVYVTRAFKIGMNYAPKLDKKD